MGVLAAKIQTEAAVNYFAHLTLARPNVESKVGNLLGDFMRGVREEELPDPVRRGLANHRLVDRVTDQHPAVVASRRLFSPQRRRFAGVALDVLFDHFLIRHWQRFHHRPLQSVIRADYAWLAQGEWLMPEAMCDTTRHMVEFDWINHYATVENVGRALDRIAARVRFRNEFAGALEDILEHYDQFEDVFLVLYPQLQETVRRQGLERTGAPD